MEHIEEAGVHSGDSACAIPPQTLSAEMVARIETQTRALADALDVRGLLNVQYAVKGDELYVIEANPRASRTVPFVSKATGVPLAKVASRVMVGATLAELRDEGLLRPPAEGGHVAVKEAVLPFNRFPDVDTVLGPEMRSTGEVMGIDRTFGMAFAKSQTAAGNRIPRSGTVFLSLADRDKTAGVVAARRFAELGYTLIATAGTAAALEDARARGGSGGRQDSPDGEPRLDRRDSTRSSSCSRGRSTWWSTRPGVGVPGPTAPTSAAPPPPGASPASPRWRRPWRPRPASSSGSRPRPRSGRSRSTTATASSGSRSSAGDSHDRRPERRPRPSLARRARCSRQVERSATATRWRGSATRAGWAR